MLEKGTTIYGLSKTPPYSLKQYRVIQIKQKFSKDKISFYSVSVDPHNFIGNNLILHNQDEFEIDIVNIQTGQTSKLNFFKNQIIEERLKQYDVKIAGMVLDSNCTFEDYQLHKMKKLFICQKQSKKQQNNEPELINQHLDQVNNLMLIDLDKKEHINFQQLDKIDKLIYQNHYLGINGFRISSVNSKHLKITKDNIESIVFQKIYLQRMQFLERIDSQFRPNQEQIYKLIDRIICQDSLTVWKNSRVRQRLEEKKKGQKLQQLEQFSFQLPTRTKISKLQVSNFIKDFFMIKDLKLLTIFLTQQRLFQKVNQKLESLPNFDTDSYMNKEYYGLIGLIYEAIIALPIKQTIKTVYRRVQVHGDLFADNIGQIIMFEGFTLTHRQMSKTIEQTNNGVIFKIRTTSARCVQKIFGNQQKQQNYFVLLPYTCFIVQEYDKTQHGASIVKLVQIPLPSTNAKGIVLQMNYNYIDNTRLSSKIKKLEYHLRLQSALKQIKQINSQSQYQKFSEYFKQQEPLIRTEKQKRQISSIKSLLSLISHQNQKAYELERIRYDSQQQKPSNRGFDFKDQDLDQDLDQDSRINMYYSFQCLLDKLKTQGAEACIQDLHKMMEIQAFRLLASSRSNLYPKSIIEEKLNRLNEKKAVIQLLKGQKRNKYKIKNYIEVISVLQSNIMHRILQDFYPIYKLLNKKVILSLNTDKKIIQEDYNAQGYSIETILDPNVWKYKDIREGYPDIRQNYAQHEQKLIQFVKSTIDQFSSKGEKVQQKKKKAKNKVQRQTTLDEFLSKGESLNKKKNEEKHKGLGQQDNVSRLPAYKQELQQQGF